METKLDQSGQTGASAVEFAFVLPLLVILVFGIIEFSVLAFDKAMITNASREGARAGIVYRFDPNGGLNHPDDAEIVTTVNQYVQNYLINFGASSGVTTTITRTGDAAGDPLTIRVEYQYDFLVLPGFISTLVGGINLVAETVMRLE